MACSTIPQGYDPGENLRLPAAITQWPAQAANDRFLPGLQPGKVWRVNRSREQDKTQLTVWSVTHRSELLSILAMRDGPGPSPEDYVRQVSEEEGKTACLTQTSDILDSSPVRGFARVLRLTTCTLGGLGPEKPERDNLLLYIQGRDAHYVLIRTWHVAPTDADLRQWQEYFRGVSICDTRWSRGARCPLETTVAP
jgi:hypothetical protein